MPINQTANISNALIEAYGIASEKRNEFITPEHLLAGFLKDSDFWEVLGRCGRAEELEKNLYEYINGLDRIPEDHELSIEFSAQLQELFEKAGETAASAMAQVVQTHHLIFSIFHLEESYARYHLESCLECSIPDFLNSLLEFSEAEVPEGMEPWRKYFKELESIGEYVGKKEEIQKIFRTLCRHKKANVLIVGDRGVGKTAMACEIARLLQDKSAWKNDVPEKLHNMSLMELDVPLLLGGTQYRGDLEMRVKEIMERVSEEGDPIIYIDDLRTLGGNSRNDDGSKDILNLLIPYLKSSNIRCIISCTYEDIKKVENINSGALSLFQRIELKEPDADETFEIIKHNTLAQLETSHKTKYSETICRFAIEKSMRFISDRCLPEKAIDLLDRRILRNKEAEEGLGNKCDDSPQGHLSRRYIHKRFQRKSLHSGGRTQDQNLWTGSSHPETDRMHSDVQGRASGQGQDYRKFPFRGPYRSRKDGTQQSSGPAT